MRADLLEYVCALGFRSFSDGIRPCLKCGTTPEDMYNFPATVETASWSMVVQEAYQAQVEASIVCKRCKGADLWLLRSELKRGKRRKSG